MLRQADEGGLVACRASFPLSPPFDPNWFSSSCQTSFGTSKMSLTISSLPLPDDALKLGSAALTFILLGSR